MVILQNLEGEPEWRNFQGSKNEEIDQFLNNVNELLKRKSRGFLSKDERI